MFAHGEHKFKVGEHKFAVGEHKFTHRKHKNIRVQKEINKQENK
jgi:hypothetical protein